MKCIMVRNYFKVCHKTTQKAKINMRIIKEFLWDLFTITGEWSVTTGLLTMACIRAGGEMAVIDQSEESISGIWPMRDRQQRGGSQTESELIICNSISPLISNLAFFSPAGVRLNWSQLLNNKWNALFSKGGRKIGPRSFMKNLLENLSITINLLLQHCLIN